MGTIDILAETRQIESDIIQWRRALHQIPELGLELPQTVGFVTHILDKLEVTYDDSYVNGNAIVATIVGTKNAPSERVLAIRADMDGLPIKEETGLAFSSINDNMHACGHDGHTAVLLGVAKLLQAHRDQFSGTVKLLFQPGEESPGGAQPMIDEGVMENPTVTRVIGAHQGAISPESTGSFNLKSGPLMAAPDIFSIEITGQGYHGAYPESSHDPIAALGQLITAIQTIKSRNIPAIEPAVISITRVQGGTNHNIIPERVFVEGTVRTLNEAVRQRIKDRLKQICLGVGATMDLDCNLTYTDMYPALINDDQVTEDVYHSLAELFSETHLNRLENPLMGGEDMACFLQQAPGTYFFIHNPGIIDGKFHGHHHPKFDIDESKLHLAVAAFIKITLDYLN